DLGLGLERWGRILLPEGTTPGSLAIVVAVFGQITRVGVQLTLSQALSAGVLCILQARTLFAHILQILVLQIHAVQFLGQFAAALGSGLHVSFLEGFFTLPQLF